MRRVLLFALVGVCLLGGGALAAGTGQTLLEAGRQAYAAGRYAEAATALGEAASADPRLADAGLCLDAATASQLAGDPGRAGWWLYRAQHVAPGDGEVRKALAAAGLTPLPAGLPLGDRFSPRVLWWVVLGANAVFWLGLAASRLFSRPIPRPALVLAVVVLVWLWGEAGWSALAPILAPRGVVLVATPARSAPEPAAEALFSLPPGALVWFGPSRQGFVRVETQSGRAGWASRDAVATLPQ